MVKGEDFMDSIEERNYTKENLRVTNPSLWRVIYIHSEIRGLGCKKNIHN